MRISPIATFAAGFLAGGMALGGIAAHAGIITLNGSVAGVLPNSGGSMFCAPATGWGVLAVTGTYRQVSVNATGGGTSIGVELRCP